jgi:S1-C subfamily serine protease
VTAYHVIADSQEINIVGADGVVRVAQLTVADRVNDLAVLTPESLPESAIGISVSDSLPSLGSQVFTIGFPHPDILGVKPKMTSGDISSTTGMRDDPRLFQISVPIQSGNSGGPLLDSRGHAIGIVVAKLSATTVLRETGDLPQNINYAIKARYLKLLLSELPKRNVQVLRVEQPQAGLAGLVVNAVFLIVAE